MRKILFYLIFISALSNAQTTGKSCSECIPSTSGVPNDYVLTNNSGIPTWQAGGGGGTNYWTSSGGNIYNNTGTNVGIGTTSPYRTLTVQGQGQFEDHDESANALVSYNWTLDGNAFRVDNSSHLFLIDEGGLGYNFGIGTGTPIGVLDVNGSNNSHFYINDNDEYASLSFNGGDDQIYLYGGGSSGDRFLQFYINDQSSYTQRNNSFAFYSGSFTIGDLGGSGNGLS